MSGKSQGILRGENVPECGEPCWRSLSYSSIGARRVWSVLQLVSHIYTIKPASCQNNPAKSLLWMRLHHFQYLCCIHINVQKSGMIEILIRLLEFGKALVSMWILCGYIHNYKYKCKKTPTNTESQVKLVIIVDVYSVCILYIT